MNYDNFIKDAHECLSDMRERSKKQPVYTDTRNNIEREIKALSSVLKIIDDDLYKKPREIEYDNLYAHIEQLKTSLWAVDRKFDSWKSSTYCWRWGVVFMFIGLGAWVLFR